MVNDNCHKWGVIIGQIPSICYQDIERKQSSYINQELSLCYKVAKNDSYRLRAKKGPAPPPLGNFADISYLEENFKPHLLRDVCTLCSGALVSYSLFYMLLYQTKEKIKMKV